ncbi:host cell division inhibitor Icd-like protein, partial [Escherichia coli]|nr:host cell division inhibitor Icd-like protein [Escherichia coli]
MPAVIYSGKDQFLVLNFFPPPECTGYSFKGVAKTGAGPGEPGFFKGIPHAPRGGFFVAGFV